MTRKELYVGVHESTVGSSERAGTPLVRPSFPYYRKRVPGLVRTHTFTAPYFEHVITRVSNFRTILAGDSVGGHRNEDGNVAAEEKFVKTTPTKSPFRQSTRF